MKKKHILLFTACALCFCGGVFSLAFAGGTEFLRARSGSMAAQDATLAARENAAVEYFISPEDEMEIFVWQSLDYEAPVKKTPVSPDHKYHIASGDVIEIFVWQNADLSKDVIVGPDGEISIPLVGRILAAGLTIDELEKKIDNDIALYVKSPQVSVMVKQFSNDKFSGDKNKIIDQLNAGRSYIVGPEGKISYPFVGRIQAAGFTIDQLEHKISELLAKYIDAIQVSIVIKKFAGEKIIVLGEVGYPGIYTYKGRMDLIQVVALAGDFKPNAHADSVIIVHNNFNGQPEVRRVNMSKVISRGVRKENIILQPGDVVYVPKTFIGNLIQCMNDLGPLINNANTALQIRNTIRTQVQGHRR